MIVIALLTSQAEAGWFCRLIGKEEKQNASALQQALKAKLTAQEIEVRAKSALNGLGLHESKELLNLVKNEFQLEVLETVLETTAHLKLGSAKTQVIEKYLTGVVNETQLFFLKHIASSRNIWVYEILSSPSANRTSHLEQLQELFVKDNTAVQFNAFRTYISGHRYGNLLQDVPELKINYIAKLATETKNDSQLRLFDKLILNYMLDGGRSAAEFEKLFTQIMDLSKDPIKMKIMDELTQIIQLRFWQLAETLDWIAQVNSEGQGRNLTHAITAFFLYKNASHVPHDVRVQFYDLVIATTSPNDIKKLSVLMVGIPNLSTIEQILRDGIK